MHNILFPPKFVLLILYFFHQFCKYKTAIGCNEGVDRVNGRFLLMVQILEMKIFFVLVDHGDRKGRSNCSIHARGSFSASISLKDGKFEKGDRYKWSLNFNLMCNIVYALLILFGALF